MQKIQEELGIDWDALAGFPHRRSFVCISLSPFDKISEGSVWFKSKQTFN
jgi:hypothetical protein